MVANILLQSTENATSSRKLLMLWQDKGPMRMHGGLPKDFISKRLFSSPDAAPKRLVPTKRRADGLAIAIAVTVVYT